VGPTARALGAAMLVAMGLGSATSAAQSPRPGSSPATAVALAVPYLPQSVLLCGGAALAMVERWWGRRGVYAEDFAGLVRPEQGGILTTDLAASARARGWDTRVWHGEPERIRQALREGVPVIALIQVGRARYHFVVVLSWDEGQVVFHDPARAPLTTLDEAGFLTSWSGADRWAMTLRPVPPAPAAVAPVAPDPVTPDSLPCSPWIDRALDAAMANRLDDAAGLLTEAGKACPAEPRSLRELAGVRFRQGRHAEAAGLAEQYLAVVPGDRLGWQLLASSRYLAGDRDGALEAWNRLDRPTVDLVRVEGTRRIRFREVADAISVPHGAVLTSSRLAVARRRVSDIPALRGSAVEYLPVAGGLVEVRVAVAERPRIGRPWRLVAAGAARALTRHEVGLEVASPLGAGELWSGSWRWEYARPRAVFRVDFPAAIGFPGVVGVASSWERFRFALDSGDSVPVEESRRVTGIGFGGWATAWVRPAAALRLERWSEGRQYLVVSAGAEVRTADDRFVLSVTGEHALALAAHPAHSRGGARAMWASSSGLGRAAWSARLGYDRAGANAPLGAWPVTGGNLVWAVPLRAGALSPAGVVTGKSVGREIFHAGLSGDHPVHRVGPLILAAGLFLDGARVNAAADGSEDRFHLDGGAGLRIGLVEGQLGVLRLDFARGLLEAGRSAMTIGVHQSWPAFVRGSRESDTP
jgi:hypothetical protein